MWGEYYLLTHHRGANGTRHTRVSVCAPTCLCVGGAGQGVGVGAGGQTLCISYDRQEAKWFQTILKTLQLLAGNDNFHSRIETVTWMHSCQVPCEGKESYRFLKINCSLNSRIFSLWKYQEDPVGPKGSRTAGGGCPEQEKGVVSSVM